MSFVKRGAEKTSYNISLTIPPLNINQTAKHCAASENQKSINSVSANSYLLWCTKGWVLLKTRHIQLMSLSTTTLHFTHFAKHIYSAAHNRENGKVNVARYR